MYKFNLKIRLRIRRAYVLESALTFYLLIMGLLSGYFGRNVFWVTILFLFDVLLLTTRSVYRHELAKLIFTNPPLFVAVILGCASILACSNNLHLFYNLRWWLQVFLILLTVCLLQGNANYDFHTVLRSYFFFLNFFWLANLIIVSIQCTGNGFLMKSEWFDSNSFYKDHCAGLFGAAGTHKLSLFACFIMIYDLSITKEMTSRRRRWLMYVYLFVTEVWMLFISTLNDNKTFFALLPAFLIAYYIFYSSEDRIINNFVRVIKLMPLVFLFVVIIIVLFRIFPSIYDFVRQYVVEAGLKLATLGGRGSQGSIERITIATEAMKQGYGLLLGRGLGAAAVSERVSGSYLGFKHFGMSSIGNFVTLGGFWFYLSVCMIYTHYFCQFIKYHRRSLIRWLLCMAIIMGLTVYTPIFEAPVSMIWTCLIFLNYGIGGYNALVSAHGT